MEYWVLTPCKIGSVKLKNRIIFPSMCNFYCDENGFVTPQLQEYLRARAAGGAAMVVMPGSPHGKPGPGRPALSDPVYYDGWKSLRDICHGYGCKLFVQIHPAAAQAGRDPSLLLPDNMPRDYIDGVVDSYARCARAAKEIGLDGVEIHGAHAHEVAQFLSPYYNHRQDEYGGSVKHRCKLAVDVITAIKEACGSDFPLIFRMSSSERYPGGREAAEGVEIAEILQKAGADALHVSVGMPLSEQYISAPMDVRDGFNLDEIGAIHRAVSIPVIAVNRIRTPELAEKVICDGTADFVAVGRGMLADPDFANKISTGQPVRLCIGCNQGCRKSVAKKAIFCVQNPCTGRESTLHIAPGLQGKSALVVGAGIAGLEAAIWLARRGASVELWEKNEKAGGLIELAKLPPCKSGVASMVDYRLAVLGELGVQIHTCTEADCESIIAKQPDIVVLATGSRPILPPIPGLEGVGVYTGDQVLRGECEIGKCVAVLGGGPVGVEVAEVLAERGHRVTVIEQGEKVGAALNKNRMTFVMERLKKHDVTLMTGTRVVSVSLPDIAVEDSGGIRVLDGYSAIVAAAGRRPLNNPELQLRKHLPATVIGIVGDAAGPGMAMEAVASAALWVASL